MFCLSNKHKSTLCTCMCIHAPVLAKYFLCRLRSKSFEICFERHWASRVREGKKTSAAREFQGRESLPKPLMVTAQP